MCDWEKEKALAPSSASAPAPAAQTAPDAPDLPAKAPLPPPDPQHLPPSTCSQAVATSHSCRILAHSPPSPRSPGGTYDFFLSHFRRNGGVNMLALRAALRARGLWSWLDAVEPWTHKKRAMLQGIDDSRVFVFYLTRGVLTRPFCVLELRHALKLGKPVVLLWEAEELGATWTDNDGGEQRTVGSLEDLMAEGPRLEVDGVQTDVGEFDALFAQCLPVRAQFHGDAASRSAMLDALCDPLRHTHMQ